MTAPDPQEDAVALAAYQAGRIEALEAEVERLQAELDGCRLASGALGQTLADAARGES